MSEIRELAMRLAEESELGYFSGVWRANEKELVCLVRAAMREGMMRAAAFIDARAETIRAEGNITADTMARIYEAEANAIRAEADKLEGK